MIRIPQSGSSNNRRTRQLFSRFVNVESIKQGVCARKIFLPPKLSRQPASLFLKGRAAAFQGYHLFRQVRDSACGIIRAHSARMNVGDEVSVRVRVSRAGRIGHVGRETLRGGKTRPLPDQQYDHTGRKKLADVVHDADTRVAHHKRLPDGPTAGSNPLLKELKEKWHLCGDRGAGKAV